MKPKLTMKKIQSIAEETVNEIYSQLTEKEIKEKMAYYVKNDINNTILNILGINRQWGEIRIAHDSMLYKMINSKNSKISEKAEEILQELFDNKIILTTKDKVALNKLYKETYMNYLEGQIGVLAREQALANAPEIFKEFLEQQEETV